MYTTNNNESVKELKQKINLARDWAKIHFRASEAGKNTQLVDENLNLLPPCAFVEFPDVDTMIVSPSILGKRSFIEIHYRLGFEGNKTFWKPVDHANFPKLYVE